MNYLLDTNHPSAEITNVPGALNFSISLSNSSLCTKILPDLWALPLTSKADSKNTTGCNCWFSDKCIAQQRDRQPSSETSRHKAHLAAQRMLQVKKLDATQKEYIQDLSSKKRLE